MTGPGGSNERWRGKLMAGLESSALHTKMTGKRQTGCQTCTLAVTCFGHDSSSRPLDNQSRPSNLETLCGETGSLRLSVGELEELTNDQPGSATRASLPTHHQQSLVLQATGFCGICDDESGICNFTPSSKDNSAVGNKVGGKCSSINL
jgi:hypothetical protein